MTISSITSSTYIVIWMYLPVHMPMFFNPFNSNQLGSWQQRICWDSTAEWQSRKLL